MEISKDGSGRYSEEVVISGLAIFIIPLFTLSKSDIESSRFLCFYHVRIIPVSGSGDSSKVVLVVAVEVDDVQDAGPAVHDVAVVTPQVAVVRDGSVVW